MHRLTRIATYAVAAAIVASGAHARAQPGGDTVRGIQAQTIDEYLATLSVEKRAALQHLRRAIKAAAPGVEECISYGIPAFRLDGRVLVHIGAAAKHCALYPGAYPIEAHAEELAAYDVSKGTIRFPAGRPLPASLIQELVKARIAQQAARRSKPAAHHTARRR